MEYNISIEISHIKNISERINYIRRQNNLNQLFLVKYLKERIPPADILLKLAHLGGTTIEWILTGEKRHFYAPETIHVADQESSYRVDSDIQLAQKIARLKPSARQVIENLIEMIDRND